MFVFGVVRKGRFGENVFLYSIGVILRDGKRGGYFFEEGRNV